MSTRLEPARRSSRSSRSCMRDVCHPRDVRSGESRVASAPDVRRLSPVSHSVHAMSRRQVAATEDDDKARTLLCFEVEPRLTHSLATCLKVKTGNRHAKKKVRADELDVAIPRQESEPTEDAEKKRAPRAATRSRTRRPGAADAHRLDDAHARGAARARIAPRPEAARAAAASDAQLPPPKRRSARRRDETRSRRSGLPSRSDRSARATPRRRVRRALAPASRRRSHGRRSEATRSRRRAGVGPDGAKTRRRPRAKPAKTPAVTPSESAGQDARHRRHWTRAADESHRQRRRARCAPAVGRSEPDPQSPLVAAADRRCRPARRLRRGLDRVRVRCARLRGAARVVPGRTSSISRPCASSSPSSPRTTCATCATS